MNTVKPNAATKGSIPAAPFYRIPADMRALYRGQEDHLTPAFPRAGCNSARIHTGKNKRDQKLEKKRVVESIFAHDDE